MKTQSKTNEILTEHFRSPIMLGHTALPINNSNFLGYTDGQNSEFKKNKRLEISKILYRNSTDNENCLMIKFKNMETVIDLLEKI